MKMNGERVILNVRGRRFETSKETFQRIPESRLHKLLSNSVNMEYYFDRNSILFEYILDVYKTGALHVPTHLCGGLLKQEMQYWGIPLHYIANCCLKNYSSYLDELRIIKEIGKAFANDYDDEEPEVTPTTTHKDNKHDTGVYFKNDSFESDDDTIVTPVKTNNNSGNMLLKKALEHSRQISHDEHDRESLAADTNLSRPESPTTSDQVTLAIPVENFNRQNDTITSLDKDNGVLNHELSGTQVQEASTSSPQREQTVFTNNKHMINDISNDLKQGSKSNKVKQTFNKKHFKAARKIMKPNKVSFRSKLRMFLEDPFSSKLAFVWGCVFLAIVILSVIIQCISSHPYFRQPLQVKEDEETVTTPTEKELEISTEVYNVVPNNTFNNDNSSKNIQDGGDEISTTTSSDQFYATFVTSPCTRSKAMIYKEQMYLNTDLLPVLKYIQRFCVAIFTMELLLRFAVCVNRKRFVKNIYNIVDLLALVPTAILEIMDLVAADPSDKQDNFKFVFFLGTMGVFKTLRLVKFIRHYRAMKILLLALKASIQEILLLFLLISIGMLIFSTLIYYTEFYTEDFETIPKGFWWSIVTMTTVGYGDIYPSTGWGYLVGTMCALAGMLSTGLPIPIIANNFNIYYTYAKVHTCKIEIAAHDNNMKFSKVVRIIGRISTTIKRKPETNKAISEQGTNNADNNKTGVGSNVQQQQHQT